MSYQIETPLIENKPTGGALLSLALLIIVTPIALLAALTVLLWVLIRLVMA